MKLFSLLLIGLTCLHVNAVAAPSDEGPSDGDGSVTVEASVSWDFNQDGIADTVALEKKGDPDYNQSLIFYLGAGKNKKTPLLTRPFPSSNFLYNKNPALALNPKKNLLLNVGDSGVGRNHYQNQYVIRYEGKEFFIIGVKFYIFSQESGDFTCDVNLLSHEGVLTRKGKTQAFKSELDKIKVADFDFNDSPELPKLCKTHP